MAKSLDTGTFGIMLFIIECATDRKKQFPFGGTLTRTMLWFDITLSRVEGSLLLTKPEWKRVRLLFVKNIKFGLSFAH